MKKVFASILLIVGLSFSVQAATRNWIGSTDTNFATAANWNIGFVSGDVMSFTNAGTSGTTLNNNLASLINVAGITFASNTAQSAYTINGNAITLGGNITVSAGVTNGQVINLPMTLSAARTATIRDGATLTLGGPVSGAFGFTKATGAGLGGTLILTGTNTFTGDLTLGTGLDIVSSDENMGAGTNINSVQNAKLTTTATFATSKTMTLSSNGANQDINPYAGTTLTLNGAITGGNAGATMRLGGAGKIILAASNNYGATTTILSDVTLSGAGTIGTNNLSLNSGTLNLGGKSQTVGALSLIGTSSLLTNGNITAASILVNNSSGNAIISANLHGAAVTFTKTNNGIATLSGVNDFTGATAVSGGTLIAGGDSALGSSNITVAAGATLTLTNGVLNNYISDTATLILTSGSILNLSFNGRDTISGLSLNGAPLAKGVYDATALTSGGVTCTGSGSLKVGRDVLRLISITSP